MTRAQLLRLAEQIEDGRLTHEEIAGILRKLARNLPEGEIR